MLDLLFILFIVLLVVIIAHVGNTANSGLKAPEGSIKAGSCPPHRWTRDKLEDGSDSHLYCSICNNRPGMDTTYDKPY